MTAKKKKVNEAILISFNELKKFIQHNKLSIVRTRKSTHLVHKFYEIYNFVKMNQNKKKQV